MFFTFFVCVNKTFEIWFVRDSRSNSFDEVLIFYAHPIIDSECCIGNNFRDWNNEFSCKNWVRIKQIVKRK